MTEFHTTFTTNWESAKDALAQRFHSVEPKYDFQNHINHIHTTPTENYILTLYIEPMWGQFEAYCKMRYQLRPKVLNQLEARFQFPDTYVCCHLTKTQVRQMRVKQAILEPEHTDYYDEEYYQALDQSQSQEPYQEHEFEDDIEGYRMGYYKKINV